MRRRDVLGWGLAAALGRPAMAARLPGGSHAIIDAWGREQGFAGVIAFARQGRIHSARAVGLASIERPEPMTAQSRFAIGSVSKWFTTLAVLRLADAGRLSLDSPIGRWLPEMGGDVGSNVRVLDLLANRSGIPDRLSRAAREDRSLRTTNETALALAERFAIGPLEASPDSKFDYAAINWVIVRALVERLTSSTFEKVIQREVLGPLGLRQTSIASRGFAAEPGLVPAYGSTAPPVRKADPVPAALAASGTFVSTAGDLLRAPHRVFSTSFLSPAARSALTNVRSINDDYALGGRVRVIAGRRFCWETGKIGGYRTHVAHDIAADRGVVLLGNTDMAQGTIAELVEKVAILV